MRNGGCVCVCVCDNKRLKEGDRALYRDFSIMSVGGVECRVAFSVVARSGLLLFTRAHTDLIVGKSVMCRTEADDHIRDPTEYQHCVF